MKERGAYVSLFIFIEAQNGFDFFVLESLLTINKCIVLLFVFIFFLTL